MNNFLKTCMLCFCFNFTVFISVQAATIQVNTNEDEINLDGDCSLREAIESINNSAEVDGCLNTGAAFLTGDTIEIPAGTYTLIIASTNEDANANGDFDILVDVNINGAGSANTIIQAGATTAMGIDRIFDIDPTDTGITVNIADIMVRHGNIIGSGGGIRICNSCTVNLVDSEVSDNKATSTGGGIYTGDSTITITNSIFDENEANSDGGGLYNHNGILTIMNSTFTNNHGDTGGGIYNDGGDFTISDSTISANTATSNGGGIFNDGPMIMSQCTVNNNQSDTYSGGIDTRSNTTILNSTLSNNQAGTDGGALNILNSNTVNIVNSTLSGNQAVNHGGALYATSTSTFNLHNVTITGNTADSDDNGTGDGGGIAIMDDVNSVINIENSILAGNLRGSLDDDCFRGTNGVLNSGGFNILDTPSASCDPSFGLDDLLGVDVTTVLNPNLADNGGSTLTHALVAGSPAINAGKPMADGGCQDHTDTTLIDDQRGFLRPVDDECDIGAVEVGICGDGAVDEANGEECDDGNLDNGDGCDSICVLEDINTSSGCSLFVSQQYPMPTNLILIFVTSSLGILLRVFFRFNKMK